MQTENRTLDLVLDSNIGFSYLMEFADITASGNTEVSQPINITGATFKGNIKPNLENATVATTIFEFKIIDPVKGLAMLFLPQAKVDLVVKSASVERDKYNTRLRNAGFYDVIMTMPGKDATRIIEGRVQISDGVTK